MIKIIQRQGSVDFAAFHISLFLNIYLLHSLQSIPAAWMFSAVKVFFVFPMLWFLSKYKVISMKPATYGNRSCKRTGA
ncbi:hypothetical protein FEM33_16790 [Dyadobacter flavalbus]|uniref:Uncharacterized protein n=1 Tax=Dyadobacter flavalbus TaxID=2579942 RepID=A0A5M8QTH3_9BACT|nr:hypothetical protein [Dyadobacter flavalbus]KAA6438350.1 hypothetical protein FEM33_16790 [Dyadobacter flavalbus]